MTLHPWRFYAVLGGLLWPMIGSAQTPTVEPSWVVNAAHFIGTDYPNGGIAHGSVFILKGNNLGACGTKVADQFPLTTTMNGTSIKVTMNGASFDAPMVYVVGCLPGGFSDQLAAIMPSNVPVGSGTLTVTYNGNTSAPVPVQVIDRGFGFLTISQQGGSGPVVIQNFNSATDVPVNTFANSAKPSQTVIAWGTGLGPDGNPDADAPKAADLPIPFELYVGGKLANVSYKGRSGCCAGFDQIIFQVPDGVSGCYVPVVARIGNVVSNFGTMSVAANGGACSDDFNFSASDIQTAQSNNRLRVGWVDLFRSEAVSPASPGATTGLLTGLDEAWAGFADLPFSSLIGLPSRVVSTPGSCTVLLSSSATFDMFGPAVLLPDSLYKSGNTGTITISGPKGSQTMEFRGDPYYQTALAAGITGFDPPDPSIPNSSTTFLDKGSFTASSGGGTSVNGLSVGSFSGQVNVPDALTFTNRYTVASSDATLDRTQPVTVTWTGGDPNGYVLIAGFSYSGSASSAGAEFYCLEHASAGQFTIPTYVLEALPVSSAGQRQGLFVPALGITEIGSSRFTASGLDVGLLRYEVLIGRTLGWK